MQEDLKDRVFAAADRVLRSIDGSKLVNAAAEQGPADDHAIGMSIILGLFGRAAMFAAYSGVDQQTFVGMAENVYLDAHKLLSSFTEEDRERERLSEAKARPDRG